MVPVSYSLLTDANGEASFSRYFLAIPPPLDGHPFDLALSPSMVRVSNEEEAVISLRSWRFNRAQWERIPLRYCHRCRWQTNPRWRNGVTKLSYPIEGTRVVNRCAAWVTMRHRDLPSAHLCETPNSLITRGSSGYTKISRDPCYTIRISLRTSFTPPPLPPLIEYDDDDDDESRVGRKIDIPVNRF